MEQTKKKSGVAGKIIDILIWIFVAFAILVTIMVFSMQNNTDGIPSMFGKSFVTILSDSMTPEFKTGDLIIVETASHFDARELDVGEVITFHSSQDIDGDGKTGDIETHRIVAVEMRGGIAYYQTQGDNREMCPVPDPFISYTEVIGRWTGSKTPGIGNFISLLSSRIGFFFFIVLPMILFFLYGVVNFVLVLVRNRQKPDTIVVRNQLDEEEIKRRAVEEYLRQQAEKSKVAESAPAAEEPAAGHAPAEEAPAEEASAEEVPAEEEPAEEAPEENKDE